MKSTASRRGSRLRMARQAAGPHLGDEQLDAFVAGRLRGRRRRAVVAHLDACPECFELYADVAHAHGTATPSSGGAGLGRWLTAVAALLMVAAMGWWALRSHQPYRGATPAASALLSATQPSRLLSELDSRPRWDAERSVDLHHLDSRQLAFRIGVTVTALDVALAAEDAERALALVEHQQLPLVRALSQRGLLEGRYVHIATHLRSGTDLAVIEADAVRAGEVLDQWLEGSYRAGAWAEASRLAANSRARGYFRAGVPPPAVDPATEIAPAALRAYLRAIEAVEASAADSDLSELSRLLDDLVAVGGGGRSTSPADADSRSGLPGPAT